MSPTVLPHKTLTLSLLGIALVLSACGGGTSEDSALTVTTPDGMATLVIAEGSLPDDVSVDDIRVEWTDIVSEESGAPFAAVMLTPSGLTLSEPATLRVEIPGDVKEILVVHSSTDGFEFLQAELQHSDDKLVAAMKIDSFSGIDLYRWNVTESTLTATPEPLHIEDVQRVEMTITMLDPNVDFWIHLGDVENPQYQLFTFRVEAIFRLGSRVFWLAPDISGSLSPNWEPSSVTGQLTSEEGITLTFEASSTCGSRGDNVVKVDAHFDVSMIFVEKGRVLDGLALGMLTVLDSSEAKISRTGAGRRRYAYRMDVGETLIARPSIQDWAPADCTGSDAPPPPPPPPPPPGQDTTNSDFVEDPVGDLIQAFPDLQEIDRERTDGEVTGAEFMEAVDFVQLEVTSTRSTNSVTTISLRFNGAAQLMPTEISGNLTSRSFGMDILIHLASGRVLNVIFDTDGKIKISDIPGGMGISSKWLTPDELLIYITGLALDPDTQVEANLLLEAYGGLNSDSVSLTTSGG